MAVLALIKHLLVFFSCDVYAMLQDVCVIIGDTLLHLRFKSSLKTYLSCILFRVGQVVLGVSRMLGQLKIGLIVFHETKIPSFDMNIPKGVFDEVLLHYLMNIQSCRQLLMANCSEL